MNRLLVALAALSIAAPLSAAAPSPAPAVAAPSAPTRTPGEALIDAMFPLPLIRQLIDEAVEPAFAREDRLQALPPELRRELVDAFVTAINQKLGPRYAAFRETNAARLSAV